MELSFPSIHLDTDLLLICPKWHPHRSGGTCPHLHGPRAPPVSCGRAMPLVLSPQKLESRLCCDDEQMGGQSRRWEIHTANPWLSACRQEDSQSSHPACG